MQITISDRDIIVCIFRLFRYIDDRVQTIWLHEDFALFVNLSKKAH